MQEIPFVGSGDAMREGQGTEKVSNPEATGKEAKAPSKTAPIRPQKWAGKSEENEMKEEAKSEEDIINDESQARQPLGS